MPEAEQTSSQVLQIEYRNQVTHVPLAQSKEELKSHLKNRVLPALTRLQKLNPKIDLAISEYVYSHDESLKGQEESTRKMLDELGGEDINEEDLLAEDLHMSVHDISDFVNLLGENGFDTKDIELINLESVSDIIEALSSADLIN